MNIKHYAFPNKNHSKIYLGVQQNLDRDQQETYNNTLKWNLGISRDANTAGPDDSAWDRAPRCCT